MHRFPDDEAHLRTASSVSDRPVVIAATRGHRGRIVPEILAAGAEFGVDVLVIGYIGVDRRECSRLEAPPGTGPTRRPARC
jgi:hypothetical protein